MEKSEASARKARQMFSSNSNLSERKGFRSLICDESGIIIGEMVYRCLLCSFINESMDKVRAHYQHEHVDIDDNVNGYLNINGDYCPSPSNSCVEDSVNNGEENEQEDGDRAGK